MPWPEGPGAQDETLFVTNPAVPASPSKPRVSLQAPLLRSILPLFLHDGELIWRFGKRGGASPHACGTPRRRKAGEKRSVPLREQRAVRKVGWSRHGVGG